VKLLFDENLSPNLVHLLSRHFPESKHVRDVGLAAADDDSVWAYACADNLVIVSKDSDFHQRSFVKGPPPKVVWLRCGNCGTQEIMDLLRSHQAHLEIFQKKSEAAFLEIG